MSKSDLVQDYINRGWVPFGYKGLYSPGPEWQRSKVTNTTHQEIVGSDNPVAILLGECSNLVVADIDPRNGGDLDTFIKHYSVPPTRVHSTPSGGHHVLFHYSGSLRKTTGDKTGVDALKGVDLLANKAHILAPPSVRIGHPDGKPDGVYSVQVGVDPIELPEALRLDWEAATARTLVGDDGSHELISPENYDWALSLHKNNVELAARAREGSRDDVCIARIGASMRICLALPDEVLSIDRVFEDYENNIHYEIKDLRGKINRAVEWAQDRVWTEPVKPANAELPEGVPPEMAAEYWDALNKLRVREAAKDAFQIEKIETQARRVKFGDFIEGRQFQNQRPENPRWLVRGLMHYEGSVLLAAAWKSGKSTMMLNLIKSLTTATPFLGTFAVPNKLRVAYVDMELGRSMAWDWFEDVPGVDYSKLVYVPRVGQGSQLNMQSETIRSKWARVLRQSGVDVLIVDPLSPVMSALGIDENSAETVRPMLDAFDSLKVEAGLQGVVVTHHTGHQNTGRARGSTAFQDWPTSIMSVVRQGEGDSSQRAFKATGRDVSVASTLLAFDPKTRVLKLESSGYNHPEADNPFE